MNSKRLAVLTCGIFLVSAGTITSIQRLKNAPSVTGINANREERLQQTTATALTQQIAQVEVEKILQGEIFRQDAPVIAQLQEQQSNLAKRLTQLHPDGSQSAVVLATASAIASKIAELEVQYAQDQVKFSNTHPRVQVRKAQIEALRQRLTTLSS